VKAMKPKPEPEPVNHVKPVNMSHAVAALACALGCALAGTAATAQPKLSEHVLKDIERHRAMAAAHEGAAQCLQAGTPEKTCQEQLQAACKGLAIGRYCGMRHEH
jgi:hypothetical protein